MFCHTLDTSPSYFVGAMHEVLYYRLLFPATNFILIYESEKSQNLLQTLTV